VTRTVFALPLTSPWRRLNRSEPVFRSRRPASFRCAVLNHLKIPDDAV